MTFTLRFLTLTALAMLVACMQEYEQPVSDKAENIKYALEEDFRRTYDPALGYPPKDRLIQAVRETKQRQEEFALRRSAPVLEAKFSERGPSNIGGRTRVILIDEGDPERKKIWTASVAGGVYVTEDVTANPVVWRNIDDYLDNLAIGALAQDPNDPNIMYMGTGEAFTNSDAVRGHGVFKSVDNGESWETLPSTVGIGQPFRYTRSMVVHPETSDIYAATREGGVQRSEDGGQSWLKVVGQSLTASNDNMFDVFYVKGVMYASNSQNIYKSETGDRGSWVSITNSNSGWPTNLSRVEFSVCESDPDVIYAVGSVNGSGSDVYRTVNGGASWQTFISPGGDFTNGQAWYDLEIAVDPFDCNHVVVGGVPIYRSATGGSTWNRFADNMHVDQHKVVFDVENQGVIYFGNDGGVYRSANGSAPGVTNLNNGYITTQYYACALHPDTFSNYMIGGTQDNGTHVLDEIGVSTGRHVWGGDGFLCHIDQNEPNYQLVSSQFGNWGLSTNGGQNFSGGQNTNGNFLTPSDYDDETGILYSQTGDGSYYRWNVKTSEFDLVNFANPVGAGISTIAVDPNVPNRVYFGTFGGSIVRVDSAHLDEVVENEILYDNTGVVSSINVMYGNSDNILATFSNYGISHSVLRSVNGGANWESVDGDLPDMPVRWGIFAPNDPTSALIATEAGVWSSDALNGSATVWTPPPAGEGTPIVRTDMLQMRQSDFVVLAATHGRGLWTSSVFSQPRAKFFAPAVHYVNSPLTFYGEASLNATSFFWQFGDGATATETNPVHTFDEIGEYPVTLTINGELSVTTTIKILPEVPLPYVSGESHYGGHFEGFEEQYGVHTLSGTGFERGNSPVVGKKGTKSGDNAYVTGVNEQFYQPNSHSVLYMPAFDFSEESIYTFSFWTSYDIDPGPDGFLIEYSVDKGRNWATLGGQRSGWYNFNNGDINSSAFPSGTSYFTSVVGGYTRYQQNVSFLSGEPEVAFRYVFRAGPDGFHPGVAIDDIQITRYEGELVTNLFNFTGEYTGDTEITLDWSTRPEYHCTRFEIEESINGRDFEKIGEVPCKGRLTDALLTYDYETQGGRSLYFYRIKVINENADIDYYHEFYTEVITVKIKLDALEVFRVFPNPFTDQVSMTFTDAVGQSVSFRMFDSVGKLILDRTEFIEGVYHSLSIGQLPVGVYHLTVQIGEDDEEVFTLMGGTE